MGWSGPSNTGPVVTLGSWKSALALASPNDRTLSANGDRQYYWDPGAAYTPFVTKNAGILTLRANSAANTVSNPVGLPYNSGAIVSAIRTGSAPAAGFFSLTTGYVEVSARLPKGNGTFPSIMLQAIADTNYEIDIVQAHGSNATIVYQTIRYSATDTTQIQALTASASVVSARQVRTSIADYSAQFHTYGVDKQADFITWYVDRVAVASYPATGIPARPYYIILSLAMGGNGDVDADATTPLPADFDIDSVSVWTNFATATGAPPTPTPTPTPSIVSGPSATGSIATVDFGSPTGQVVPRTVWGVGTGAYINNWAALQSNAAFNTLAASLNIPLFRLNAASGSGNNAGYISGGVFASGNAGSPNWTYLAPFANAPVSKGGFLSSSCLVAIGATPTKADGSYWSAADYQSIVTQTINWIAANIPAMNLWGWEVGNEVDLGGDTLTTAQVATYTNATRAGIQASSRPSVKLIGPVTSWAQAPFIQAAANTGNLDVCCYHMYLTGTPGLSSQLSMNMNGQLPGSPSNALPYSSVVQARQALAGSTAPNKATLPLMIGEWNINNVPGINSLQTTYVGAVYNAAAMINALNGDRYFQFAANWELLEDTDYGLIQNRNNTTMIPGGYVFQIGAGQVFGNRATETVTNALSTSLGVIGVAGGNGSNSFAVMLVNYSDTAAIGPGTLGLSRWPVNTSGTSTANIVTINDANPTGTTTQATVANGLLNLSIPAHTVMVVYPGTPVPTPTPTPSGTGKFSVSNGQIIGPDGNVFVARGINVYDFQLSTAITDAAATPLTTKFPHINFVRLNYGGSTSPYSTAGLEPYITRMTNNGIVVMIEDHTSGAGGAPPYTGTTLQNELAWYTSLATTYKNNPFVWFGTFNEPGQGTNLPAIWTQQKAIFDAIRGTGNTNMMSIQCPSGGNPGTVGVNGRGYDGSGPMMTTVPYNNIIIDFHYYDYAAGQTHISDSANGYSSDPATIKATLQGYASTGVAIAAAQTWQSNDGVIPVLIGEFGPSTTGNAPDDAGGTALVDIVCQSAGVYSAGFAAWHLGNGQLGTSDNLTNSGLVMTSYGNQVAGYIAAAPAPSPTPTPTPVANESANNTVVTTLNTPVIVDALGNQWNIVNGTYNGNPSQQIGFNGAAQTFTNNVVELAYVNHVLWQQNNQGNWYSMGVQNGAVITVSGPITTSPLPPAPTPTPTPPPTLPPGKTRVVAPLSSPATAGTWVTNQSFAAPMPGGGGVLRYNISYPQGYSKTSGVVWPVVFLGHENDQGMNGSSYPRDGGTLVNALDMAKAMITVAARTNYPAILVLPQIDQTLDTSGANANANGGGYADSPMSGQNEQAVAGLLKFILANEAADPTRCYIIGASLGGIWMLAQMVDNNRINGINKLWTAGMSFSDQLYRPTVPNANVFPSMFNVPVIAVSTPPPGQSGADNDSTSYDRPAYNFFIGNSGNTTYPSRAQYDSTGVTALRAGTSQYYYMDSGIGSPWTVFSYTNADGGDGTRLLDLLFSFII